VLCESPLHLLHGLGQHPLGAFDQHLEGTAVRVSARQRQLAVVALLEQALEVPSGSVELLAGLGSRDKVARIRGLSGPAAEARLDAAAIAVQAGAR